MDPVNYKVAVLGGGSWATAIVKILSENLPMVGWYMRNENAVEHIKTNNRNLDYLSSVEFDPGKLHVSSDINEIAEKAEILIFAIPSAFLKREMRNLKVPLKNKVLFSAIKGLVLDKKNVAISQFLHQKFKTPHTRIGAITGPCHAEEIAMEHLSYLTVACQDLDLAGEMADCLRNNYIKCKLSKDIYGVEYASVLKNVYAIAAGIAHGMNFGDNFQAVLMSNSIREMSKFLDYVYPMKREINDSAYLGDLLVTGYSYFSRNRMFGTMIGKGYTVKSAMMEMNMIAEGYYAAAGAYQLMRKYDMDMPILDAVYGILYEGRDRRKKFAKLVEFLD